MWTIIRIMIIVSSTIWNSVINIS